MLVSRGPNYIYFLIYIDEYDSYNAAIMFQVVFGGFSSIIFIARSVLFMSYFILVAGKYM